MADSTGIAWTDATWNPIVGCSIVSPGCTNCYAMQQAERIIRMNAGKPSHYDGTIKVVNGNPVWTGKLAKAPDHIITQPLRWKKPRRIFVNSMSDLFHEAVPDEWIDQAFAIMALCQQHTFQVLTKRSKRMREYLKDFDQACMRIHIVLGQMLDGDWIWNDGRKSRPKIEKLIDAFLGEGCDDDGNIEYYLRPYPLPNVWLGVSTEDQARADERIPDLLATPAAKRFVSAEPLLGPIKFECKTHNEDGSFESANWLSGAWQSIDGDHYHSGHRATTIDWIIAGGESGPGHRVMDVAAVSSIRLQCEAAGVPFFFKQDSGPKPGMQGRATDALWARKEFPS